MSVHLHTDLHHVHFPSVLDIRCNGMNSLLESIKKCFQAIWEFIQRMFSKEERKRITMDDVDNIIVFAPCAESYPCQHESVLFLKGGNNVSGLNAYEICSIVSRIAKERINITNNPENPWTGDAVIEHFKEYAQQAAPAEEVLNRIFPRGLES